MMPDNDLPKELVPQHVEEPLPPITSESEPDSRGPQDEEEPEWHLDFKIIMTFIVMMIQFNASSFSLNLISPVISYINEDLGPKPYYFWMAIAWPLAFSVTMAINGRLSDLFGRRWMMIGGNLLCVVASIIGGTAKSVGVVILAVGLNGIAGAIQQNASAAVSELCPRKYRPQAASSVAGSGVVGGAFGIPIAIHLANKLSWRWGFWITLLCAGISTFGLFFFYFPPNFDEVHQRDHRTKWEEFRDIDWIGIFLFISGFTVLLLGISWGGQTYPWKSVGVIVSIILGSVTIVALGLWEVYGNSIEPIIPYKLFKNVRGFTMVLVTEFTTGMLLYAMAALYPIQIQSVYETNPSISAWESSTYLMGTYTGIFLAGNTIGRVGHARLLFVTCVIMNTVCTGCMALMKPNTLAAILVLTTLTGFTIGFIQLIGIVMIMLNCPDEDIGLAVGLNGTARSIGGSIATAIYSTVLTNKVGDVLPGNVAKAVLPLGFPLANLKPLIEALLSKSSEAMLKVPGVTLPILDAAGGAVKVSYAQGYKLVYLIALAFGGIAIICAACTRNIDHLLTNDVAAKLHAPRLSHKSDTKPSHVDVEAPVYDVGKE